MPRRLILITLLFLIIGCDPDEVNQAPIIAMETFPFVGDSLTPFHFDLRKSTDAEDLDENLTMEFDWESDGIYDTLMVGLEAVVHSFHEGGFNYVTSRITDRDGGTAQETDSLYIFPKPVFGEMTDPRDGRNYKTVYLSSRWWMAEHLKYGVAIDTESDPSDNEETEFYYPENNPDNFEHYGGLYTWHETMNYNYIESTQGACPQGWHIPSSDEWDILGEGIPTIFLSYYYGPNGPGGLDMRNAGIFLIYIEQKVVQEERYFLPVGRASVFWSSTFFQRRIYGIKGKEATREIRESFIIETDENSIHDPLREGFRTNHDIFHIKGDLHLETDFDMPYYISAKSIRCIKDVSHEE